MPDKDLNPKADDENTADAFSDFSFAPNWAREKPSVHAPPRSTRWEDDRDSDGPRRRRGPRDPAHQPSGSFRRRRNDEGRASEFRAPSPDRERRRHQDIDGAQSDRPPTRNQYAGPQGGPRFQRQSQDSPATPPPPDLPLEVRILPAHSALTAIIRRVAATYKAFPLRDIARLFTENPHACSLRIGPTSDAAQTAPPLFQCKLCGMPTLAETEIEAHLIADHLDTFFAIEDIEQPEPTGNFTCVLRCRQTDRLLGPPNYHGTTEQIKDLIRTQFPNMPEETYRARLETLHDPEAIEQWKSQSRTKRVYRRKTTQGSAPDNDAQPPPAPVPTDAQPDDPVPAEALDADAPAPKPEGETLNLETAEFLIRRDIAPKQIRRSAQLTMPVAVALRSPSETLRRFLQYAWENEHHRPANLCFALRGAFRAKKLNLIKANEAHGPEFVLSRPLSPIDPLHSVPEICQLLDWIADHPGGTRAAITEDIGKTYPKGPDHLASQLTWLAEKGHIVEFFNGELALAERHPKYRFPRRDTPPRQHEAPRRHRDAPTQKSPTQTPADQQAAAAPPPPPAPEPTPADTPQAPPDVLDPEPTVPEDTPQAPPDVLAPEPTVPDNTPKGPQQVLS